MKQVDLTNVKEAGEFTRLPAGAYVCVIRDVADLPEKEQLVIHYDIAAGEFKGYYDEMRDRNPDADWIGRYTKSYKPSALSFFKRFCTAVSRSNGKYVFDGGAVNADEHTLVGKKIGLLMGEEEYYSNSGELRTRLNVVREFSIDKLGEQKVPELKKIKDSDRAARSGDAVSASEDFMNIPDTSDGKVPFN